MSNRCSFLKILGCVGLLVFTSPLAQAVCAKVVIQIEQELTLEREGFEARLAVTNNLPFALENFRVTLKFADEEGNPVGAYTTGAGAATDKFFYRLQTGYTVPSSIAVGVEKKVTYLIVPTPGASGDTAGGAIYFIGATIKYVVEGAEQVVEVAPDSITVKPMPLLQLQYFLPGDVYGDDPHTLAVEPKIPFSLGLRVVNHSAYAKARKVSILAAQPEITDNALGLLIDFKLLGSRVMDQAATPTLQVKLGDILPKRAAVANWLMTASLSGSFSKFSAEVEHAPEFGGALTSLIPQESVTTQRLIGQVLVDQAGRDGVTDFLATTPMSGVYTSVRIYQSDNDEISEPVEYFSPAAPEVVVTALAEPKKYTLSVSAASDVFYVLHSSPISADQTVRAVRSDGKILTASNCWVSKTREGSGPWQYWLNLFDTNKTLAQSYTLTFSAPPPPNRPPVLTLPAGRNYRVIKARPLVIKALAVDPDGQVPIVSAGLLPDGAVFSATNPDTGTFTWIPSAQQVGAYSVQFKASDGLLLDSKAAQIQVVASGAELYAAWTEQHWPGVTDPAIIGQSADPDGDGIANLLEYALDGDPTRPDDSILPQVGLESVAGQSYLALTHRQRTDDDTLLYEVVASDDLSTPLAQWTVQSQTLSVPQDDLPAVVQLIKIRDSVPSDSITTGGRYLRLRVTRN